jgi:hypothetical protein
MGSDTLTAALRDQIEAAIRGWDAYEKAQGSGLDIIDFDCLPADAPQLPDVPIYASRLAVLEDFVKLRGTADGNPFLLERLDADIAYLEAVLGRQRPLSEYTQLTQGCPAAGWPSVEVEQLGAEVRELLVAQGIEWGPNTRNDLKDAEGAIGADDAAHAIRSAAVELDPTVRDLAQADAEFELLIESAESDQYWSYWLDGNRDRIRLRLNRNKFSLTKVQARQFALHEVLGHGLQYVSIAEAADPQWVRLFSVHAPTQVLFEGLAQALPLLVVPDDAELRNRVLLDHYVQHVRAELHVAINEGASISACVTHARARVPYWSDDEIADELKDRTHNPLLRSYLWSYPAGFDWFVRLFADREAGLEVLRAAYRSPLTPSQLRGALPQGPPIGGTGGSIRLRQPALSVGAPRTLGPRA